MTFRATQVAVGTSAVELTAAAETDTREGRSLAILGVTVDVFLGATNGVTTGTGAKLPTGASLALDLASGERIWAIAAGAGTAHLVETGV